MMPDAISPSPGTWATIVAAAAATLATIIGIFNSTRQTASADRLITSQVEAAGGQKERAHIDGITSAGKYVLETIEDSRRTIEILRAERNDLREQLEVLTKERHRMVNRTAAAEMRWALLKGGMSLEEVERTPIKPIYEIEDEPGEGS